MPVLINNESDYLGPSQACVNPLFVSGASLPAGEEATRPRPRDAAEEDGSGDTSAAAPPAVPPQRRTRRRRASGIVLRAEGGDAAPEGRRSLNPVVEGGHPAGAVAEDITATAPPPGDVPSAVRSTTVTVKSKPKTVTLSDCLSCSGCVTSAEAVLMSRHSADALREEAARAAAAEIGDGVSRRRDLVFTVSPASLADLRRHLYGEEGGGGEEDKAASAQDEGKTALPTAPTRQMFLRDIADFLGDEFGATLVIDGSVPQRASLEEAAAEFRRRYEDDAKLGRGEGAGPPDTPPPSVALSSTRTRFVEKRPGVGGQDEEVDVTVVEHPPGLVLEEDLAMGPGDRPSADHASRIVAGPPRLPVLSSSCPGFVCLAEKTAPAAVSLLSSAKSPMAAAGALIKAASERGRRAGEGRRPEAPYHVAVMPCHDKKLEAGRDDLTWEGGVMSRLLWGSNDAEGGEKGADGETGMVREVDLVITTGELLGLLGTAAGAGDDGDRVEPAAVRSYLDKRRRSRKEPYGRPTLVSIDDEGEDGGGDGQAGDPSAEALTGVHGSGSYADYVFRSAALGLFGCDLSDSGPLPWRGASHGRAPSAPQAATDGGVIRRRRRRGAAAGEAASTDIRELTLYALADGTHSCDGSSSQPSVPVLRFAAAYGFKNVQSVLRGLSSPGTTAGGEGRRYDYVEVMACPSGCANGGGQVGPGGRKETPRGARERARAVASAVPVVRPPGAVGLSADGIGGRSLLLGGPSPVTEMETFGRRARGLLHTRFHVVPKLELTSGAAAGVAVSDTNW